MRLNGTDSKRNSYPSMDFGSKKVTFVNTSQPTNPIRMKPIIVICGFLSFAGSVIAQERGQQFYAHEDIVKPSMNAAYVNFVGKVKEAYQKHNVAMNWSTLRMDDNTYVFFSPIKDFDIGSVRKSFADAQGKMGTEPFASLWSEKGNYIESHSEFITAALPQYNYLAPAEGENFRHMMFWFPLPGKQAEVDQLMKEWIELHRSKNAPRGYETFRTVFGGEPGYVIVNWGKDQLDNVAKAKATNELFGEAGAKLWARTLAVTSKMYNKDGWFLPALSYNNQPVMVK